MKRRSFLTMSLLTPALPMLPMSKLKPAPIPWKELNMERRGDYLVFEATSTCCVDVDGKIIYLMSGDELNIKYPA
jgi:hypothetical protein